METRLNRIKNWKHSALHCEKFHETFSSHTGLHVLRSRHFYRLPGWLNLHWNKFLTPTGGLFPVRKNGILRLNGIHNDPLIGAHMFSQRASVTKLPGLVWSMKQVLEETYWQVLWSNQRSQCACSVKAHWRLEALLLGAHLCTGSLWVRTDSMDQGNLQHCWVL